VTELSLVAPNGYSQVASLPAGSRLVWTSGQVPVDADGAVAVGDWAAQTRQVLRNVETALAAAGAGWGHVFKLTIYVTDVAELATVRAVRDEFVDTTRPPTSTLVRVAGLVRPDFLIEIEAVAALPA
jgi:enamine deaminase RidA (YjgF/YER057c/UK114 family)